MASFSKNKTIKKYKGFSIGEVILSAFVLAVGIVAMIGLVSNSIRHSIDSRDEIIASHLAQEGVELVRNIRDNNYAATPTPRAYDAGIVNGSTCVDDNTATDTGVAPTCPASGYILYFNTNSASLKYRHNNTYSQTKFSRKIIISNTNPPQPVGKQIESRVWWGGSADPGTCNVGNKCVTAVSTLTDWNN